jgi:two-component system nitrate/nitrite response regulator NarL
MSVQGMRLTIQTDEYPVPEVDLSCESEQETGLVKTIILVMGNRLFRDGIELVLQRTDRLVVGSCSNLTEAKERLISLQEPDLIIFGVSKREYQDDLARMKELRALTPNSKWIILCGLRDIQLFRQMVESGVNGVLLEEAPREALHLLADLVLLGYSCLPSSAELFERQSNLMPGSMISSQIITAPPLSAHPATTTLLNQQHYPRTPSRSSLELPQLQSAGISGRERDIMHCLVSGQSNKLIARELNISEATVKVHVKALLRKMRVANRTQAAIWALNTMRSAEMMS